MIIIDRSRQSAYLNCIDVLHQLKAVQSALDRTSESMLKQHLETCVVEAIEKQDSGRVIDELMQVFRKAPGLYMPDEEFSEEVLAIMSTSNKCCG